MSSYYCFLIWVLNGDDLLECALKVHRSQIPQDADNYPMDFRDHFHGLLPLHVKSCGPIVKIETIFEVHVVQKSET